MAALISDKAVRGKICHRQKKKTLAKMISNVRALRQLWQIKIPRHPSCTVNLSYTATLSGINQEVKGSKLKAGVTAGELGETPHEAQGIGTKCKSASLPKRGKGRESWEKSTGGHLGIHIPKVWVKTVEPRAIKDLHQMQDFSTQSLGTEKQGWEWLPMYRELMVAAENNKNSLVI